MTTHSAPFLLVVDTETSGLDPSVHGVLSVGCVAWKGGSIVATHEIYIRDRDFAVDPDSMAINGLDLDWIREHGLSPEDAVRSIETFLVTSGLRSTNHEKVRLAGHNLTFDIPFLKRLFKQAGRDLSEVFSHRSIDTASILGFLSIANVLPDGLSSSSKAFSYFGIDISSHARHTALADALATSNLLNALVNVVDELRVQSQPHRRAL